MDIKYWHTFIFIKIDFMRTMLEITSIITMAPCKIIKGTVVHSLCSIEAFNKSNEQYMWEHEWQICVSYIVNQSSSNSMYLFIQTKLPTNETCIHYATKKLKQQVSFHKDTGKNILPFLVVVKYLADVILIKFQWWAKK